MQCKILFVFSVLLRGSMTFPLDIENSRPVQNDDIVSFDMSSVQNIQYEELIQKEFEHEEMVKTIQKRSIGVPNISVGRLVETWSPGFKNPEELSFYKYGDILLPDSSISIRNGLTNGTYRWPKGTIPYKIANTFNDADQAVILNAISEYHKNTCIKFVPYTGVEKDYISIEKGNTGCWSSMGRVGGKQVVNLQSPGCLFYIGTSIHELLHTIGFFHEQSRLDRDDFVKIVKKNIIKGMEPNFAKENSITYNVPYDYGSVMHYSKNAFSKNDRATIETKTNGAVIGQRKALSASDIEKIRIMYRCVGTVSAL